MQELTELRLRNYTPRLPNSHQVKVNKAEFVQALATATDVSQASASRSFDAFVEILKAELAGSGEVSIAGFGTFRKAARSERSGRNPRTGELIVIPASTGVRFVPAAALKAAVKSRQP